MRVIPNEDILVGVVPIDDTLSLLTFNGFDQSLIFVIAYLDKAVQGVIELPFGLPVRSEGGAGSTIGALDDVGKWAGWFVPPPPAHCRFFSPGRRWRQQQVRVLIVLQPAFTGAPEGG